MLFCSPPIYRAERIKKVPLEGNAVGVMLLLVCAVLASLTAGVLLAYGICVGMFRIFRIHAEQVAQARRHLTTAKVVEG